MDFTNKNILVGVCGGIAAYKIAELVRIFKRQGANVNVIMTHSAAKFVSKTTFQVLSENNVLIDLFEEGESKGSAGIKHIDLATNADAVVIAPATANIIAKLATGIADDALSTTMLAVTAPVMVCPAMNTNMYENLRVQRNLDILTEDGFYVLEPDFGELACKVTGPGRLPDPKYIVDRLESFLSIKDLKDKKVLISAGPTLEAIDPVRYISNHSSGKMGYQIARAAERRGGKVILVSGPVAIDPPSNVQMINIESCDQMAENMLDKAKTADIIIKVAAVADYKPKDIASGKIKKKDLKDGFNISFEENIDILKSIGEKKRKNQFLVGFAAETNDLEKNACLKIEKKNLDMIVANPIGLPGAGFKEDTNKIHIFYKDGTSEDFALMAKKTIADILIDRIIARIG
ncbi:MAG: bifunctional phosphopantothenoylcysteine decarboxylase/phosphopantothenate--cysteine ligase CoaBC [Desulfobacteraceae bacterium]|nr:bifunctional phosphopantothenoylcysteine decarboxylase/phosphopantothenate--cysteine ligase CoaBC [Desulfobacteraceae bacterium]